jgi:hypothetical protein
MTVTSIALRAADAVVSDAAEVAHRSAEADGDLGSAEVATRAAKAGAERAEYREQATMVRDLFGPIPFRSVALDSSLLTWHGGTVVKLAEAICQERRWEDVPILADALEEAGCVNQDILRHCRNKGGVHVRGCWVLDLLLNKG